MKTLKTITIILAFASSLSFACEGFLPKNNLYIPVSNNKMTSMTELQFNAAIDEIKEIYEENDELHFEIRRDWKNATVNAYAQGNGRKYIEIYGGIARHPEITLDGLKFVVCHEIGHLLGGYPRYKNNVNSVEGQADYYATTKCLRKVFSRDEDTWKITELKTVPEIVKTSCKSAFPTDSWDEKVCIRSSMAGLSVANLFVSLFKTKPVDFNRPDKSKVTEIFESHPLPQCRLDTAFQGALCPEGHMLGFEYDNEIKGACHEAHGYKTGLRSSCWFVSSVKTTNNRWYENGYYEGEFNRSTIPYTRSGKGTFYSGPLEYYEGLWKDDELYYGKYINFDETYEGEFNGFSYKGKGKKTDKHATYEGIFSDHDSFYGTITFKDGRIFIGNWEDDGPTDYGYLKLPDGAIYDGWFDEGSLNGHGTFVFPDGSHYIGHFVDGQFDGYGVFRGKNGMIQEGLFSKNKLVKAEKNYVSMIFRERKGKQVWATDDLRELFYLNGDPIPEANTQREWNEYLKKKVGAYMRSKEVTGGFLYNQYALKDIRGLGYKGYRLPLWKDWNKLCQFLGGPNACFRELSQRSSLSLSPDGIISSEGEYIESETHIFQWALENNDKNDVMSFYLRRINETIGEVALIDPDFDGYPTGQFVRVVRAATHEDD